MCRTSSSPLSNERNSFGETCLDLSLPLGPMTACTSPLLMESVTPFRISLPSTLARRSRISKSANFPSAPLDFIRAIARRLAHPRGSRHWRAQQPFVHLLLVHAGQPGASRDVLDGAVAVTDREPAPSHFDHLGHVAVLGGELGELADASFKV